MRKLLPVLSAIVLFSGTVALAQMGPHRGGPPGGPNGPGFPHHPPHPPLPPPQTPEEQAERCVHRLTFLANFAANRMTMIANVGVNLVNHAQENGNDDVAANLAEIRVGMINASAQFNSNRVELVLEHCLEALMEMEASEELINLVQDTAEEKLAAIATARAAQIQRVEDALAD